MKINIKKFLFTTLFSALESTGFSQPSLFLQSYEDGREGISLVIRHEKRLSLDEIDAFQKDPVKDRAVILKLNLEFEEQTTISIHKDIFLDALVIAESMPLLSEFQTMLLPRVIAQGAFEAGGRRELYDGYLNFRDALIRQNKYHAIEDYDHEIQAFIEENVSDTAEDDADRNISLSALPAAAEAAAASPSFPQEEEGSQEDA